MQRGRGVQLRSSASDYQIVELLDLVVASYRWPDVHAGDDREGHVPPFCQEFAWSKRPGYPVPERLKPKGPAQLGNQLRGHHWPGAGGPAANDR